MTSPTLNQDLASAATQTVILVTDDSLPSIQRLAIPGAVYEVRPGRQSGSAVVCNHDFAMADVLAANPVAPTWSNPDLVLAAYGLEPARDKAAIILNDVFSGKGSLKTEVERNAESSLPELVFLLSIPRDLKGQRSAFLDRYVREVSLPSGMPIPVLLWQYT